MDVNGTPGSSSTSVIALSSGVRDDVDDEMSLCHGSSPSFQHESHASFASLYAQLYEEDPSSRDPDLPRPDLCFILGDDKLEAHKFVMALYCRALAGYIMEGEEGWVGMRLAFVPDYIGVSPAAFRIFREAIYLKELTPTSFDTWLQVRRLAELFGCKMVLDKIDDVQISLTNCAVIWDKWPEGSGMKERVLTFIKGNLKILIDSNKSLDFSDELWLTILSSNDLTRPAPSEDELFLAALKWQRKKRGGLGDGGTFRRVFKDLFRYPLMTKKLLLSPAFRDSGILDPSEVVILCAEKEGYEQTNFDRTSRVAEPRPGPSHSLFQVASTPSSSPHEQNTSTRGDLNSQSNVNVNQGVGNEDQPKNGQNERGSSSSSSAIRDERGRSSHQPASDNDKTSNSSATDSLSTVGCGVAEGQESATTTSASSTPATLSVRSGDTASPATVVNGIVMTHSGSGGGSEEPMDIKMSISTASDAMGEENENDCDSRRLQRKRCRSRSGSHERASPHSPSASMKMEGHESPVSLTNPSQRKKIITKNFKELQHALQNATAEQEIELMAGVFDGDLRITTLPEGVRIFGAGPATIVRASGAEEYIWCIDAGKGCTVEGLRFEKEWASTSRNNFHMGLWITSDGLKVHNVSFLGCHLEVDNCDGAEISNVAVESSDCGISLDRQTKNASVKNSSFTSTTTGIGVWGCGNAISNVACVDVGTGVFFDGTWKKTWPCHGDSINGLTYTFSNQTLKGKRSPRVEQTAVIITASEHNVVEKVKCLGGKTPKNGKALWIQSLPNAPACNNMAKEVSGGPVYVSGIDNVLEDVTDCPFLQAIGSGHHFTNCVVGKAEFSKASNITRKNCRFSPSSS